MIRIHNSITSFRLRPLNGYNLIKGVKIYHLFSEKDKIDKFLTKTEINIRITTENNWNSVIGEGNTTGFYE
jgi:hypothetical protein